MSVFTHEILEVESQRPQYKLTATHNWMTDACDNNRPLPTPHTVEDTSLVWTSYLQILINIHWQRTLNTMKLFVLTAVLAICGRCLHFVRLQFAVVFVCFFFGKTLNVCQISKDTANVNPKSDRNSVFASVVTSEFCQTCGYDSVEIFHIPVNAKYVFSGSFSHLSTIYKNNIFVTFSQNDTTMFFSQLRGNVPFLNQNWNKPNFHSGIDALLNIWFVWRIYTACLGKYIWHYRFRAGQVHPSTRHPIQAFPKVFWNKIPHSKRCHMYIFLYYRCPSIRPYGTDYWRQ